MTYSALNGSMWYLLHPISGTIRSIYDRIIVKISDTTLCNLYALQIPADDMHCSTYRVHAQLFISGAQQIQWGKDVWTKGQIECVSVEIHMIRVKAHQIHALAHAKCQTIKTAFGGAMKRLSCKQHLWHSGVNFSVHSAASDTCQIPNVIPMNKNSSNCISRYLLVWGQGIAFNMVCVMQRDRSESKFMCIIQARAESNNYLETDTVFTFTFKSSTIFSLIEIQATKIRTMETACH